MSPMNPLRVVKMQIRKPKDPEWLRLAEMPEPARSSPHRAYWVCARFLCAMHALATCSKLLKPTRARDAAAWCNAVVELGLKLAEKRGQRHLETFNLAYEYSEFEEPLDDGLLVGLRNELALEADDHWERLTEAERNVLEELAAEGDAGMKPSALAKRLVHLPGFKRTFLNRHGKELLHGLKQRGLIAPKGKARGNDVHYVLARKPAGWPFE